MTAKDLLVEQANKDPNGSVHADPLALQNSKGEAIN
jgi:hypothetical protein